MNENIDKKSPLENKKELIQAFNLFNVKEDGKINPSEIKETMKQLGFNTKNPTIYKIIEYLENESQKKGGITFEEFENLMNQRLGNKDTKEGVRNIFELFVDDCNAEYINIENLKKISKEIGDKSSNAQLKEMVEYAAQNGGKLSFDDFYNIISNYN